MNSFFTKSSPANAAWVLRLERRLLEHRAEKLLLETEMAREEIARRRETRFNRSMESFGIEPRNDK
ncbi:hypothetical protein NECAME_04740 [Necator americanus]|uniref:Uncharacterized protein n=1 Tax=Necator americanus TaxID=51031 RepID=W2SN16_NECAM|nr:hypothetical protein NECAME_04740 [Necator americanus]ETN71045.1 hypothetical protein NECAME_04740 [Necator americanus]